jgi:spectinomycin phosphotransferase
MRAAPATAQALRQRAGLGFVVPPIAGRDGIDVLRVDHRRSVAVMPFVEGRSGHFGETLPPGHRAQVVQLVAELHRATATVAAIAPRRGVELLGRTLLETALCDLERPWTGGPFGEPARAVLSESARAVRAMLAAFDHLAAAVTAAGAPPVVTHGEPHPRNLIWARDRPLLVDWDTVGLALPERDIWMLAGDGGSDLALYAELTNRRTDPHALTLYRLAWDLGDMAVFVDTLRAAHERNADAEHAWRSLVAVTTGRTVPPLR